MTERGVDMRKYSGFAHTMRSILTSKRISHAKECLAGKWGEMSVMEINFLARYVRIFGKAA